MVFGLFSKEKALEKTIAKATNKLSQQIDRLGALERLKEDGSEAALFGLCKRFSITSMKGVEDEEEKNWVVDTLVAVGPAAMAPLTRYMAKAEHLAFALRVLEKIAPRDKILEVADKLFASEPPGYVRLPDRRIDLIRWFADWKIPDKKPGAKPGATKPVATDDELVERLSPYVSDFDENSRFAAIDGMAGRDPDKIAPPLVAALIRPEEESGRIKRTIVELLEKSKAPLGGQDEAVAAVLTGPLDEFEVKKGAIVRR